MKKKSKKTAVPTLNQAPLASTKVITKLYQITMLSRIMRSIVVDAQTDYDPNDIRDYALVRIEEELNELDNILGAG